MNGIEILGLGYALGTRKVSNDDLAEIVDTNDEWITTRTGIKSRYVSENENTSDLATRAAKSAIEKSGIDKETIDCIIVATFTPDCLTPATACLVAAKLEIENTQLLAFDLNAACSGFLYALNVGEALLTSQRYNNILIIGADVTSKVMDWQDRSTCILFGDGAGALLMKRGKQRIEHIAHASGDLKGELQLLSYPMIKDFKQEFCPPYLTMNGNEVFRFAIKAMREAIDEMLEKVGCTMSEIDYLIPHQANERIINNVLKHYHFPKENVVINLDTCGNTSAASILIGLAQLAEKQPLLAGAKCLLVGFGAGFTWASTYLEL